ncbi:hypothetical protein TPS_09236 [Trichinella pseudospiralis]
MSEQSKDVKEISDELLQFRLRELVKRPEYGTVGKPIKLACNYFPLIKLQKGDLVVNRYHIDIQHPRLKLNCDESREIFWAYVVKRSDIFGDPFKLAYDGRSGLYTVDKLRLNQVGEEAALEKFSFKTVRENKPSEVTILIKPTGLVHLDFKNAEAGLLDEREKGAVQFLDILFAQGRSCPLFELSKSFKAVKNSFYFISQGADLDVKYGITLWRGLFISARVIDGFRPAINIDVSHSCFYKHQSLINLICDILNGDEHDYPNLPLVQVGSKSKAIYFPVEVCQVANCQRYNKKLKACQTTSIIRYALSDAPTRIQKCIDLVQKSNLNGDPFLKNFGVKIKGEPVIVNGRVLSPPRLEYGKGNGGQQIVLTPKDGAWYLKEFKFFESAYCESFGLVSFLPPHKSSMLQEFCRQVVRTCRSTGIQMPDNPKFYEQARQNDSVKMVFERIADKCDRDGMKCDLVFVALFTAEQYAEVKSCGDITFGLVTQCLLPRTINDVAVKKSYLTMLNIAMKINMKIGGINAKLQKDEILDNYLYKNNTLVIGVDVVHPSAVEKHLPSIAAVVGNVDINVTKFHASVQILAARQELVIGIEKQFRERLVEYNVVNKSFPKNIIVFRDGVSEGQFMQVLDEELIALRRACKSFIKNCQPLITFVVVQKRHHARFFCCDEAAARGRGKNIPAGTVVDRAVTSPDEYDFFLCSHHGIQGTSRPTRYHVLLDESNMNANTMQSITYYLCHIYGRCTRSVSIPAPVYFAHLVCARARYHVLAALNSGLVEKFSDEDSSSSSSSSKAESVKAELVKIIALHSKDVKEISDELLQFRLRELVKRPEYGTVGKPIKLACNYFPLIKLQKGDLVVNRYHIDIQHPRLKLNCDESREIFWAYVVKRSDIFGDPFKLAYDGRSGLYTVDKLRLNQVGEEAALEKFSFKTVRENKPSEVTILIKPTGLVHLDFKNAEAGLLDEREKGAVQFLDILFAQGRSCPLFELSKSFKAVKNSFYFISQGADLDVKYGITLWRGLFISARVIDGFRPAINIDVSHSCFYKHQSLINLICDILNGDEHDYPNLPLVQVGSKSKAIYFPVEVCQVANCQRYNKKLKACQTTSIIRYALSDAPTRIQKCIDLVQKSNLNGDPFLKNFGVKIKGEPVIVNGRVLSPPRLEYGKGNGGQQIVLTPKDGAWYLKEFKFFESAYCESFGLVSFLPPHKSSMLQEFCRQVVRTCRSTGIQMPDNPKFYEQARQNDSVKMVFERIADKCDRDGMKCDLVFVALFTAEQYAEVKSCGDITFGLVTQCLLPRTINDVAVKKSYLTMLNIAMKINMKIGGINAKLQKDEILDNYLYKNNTLVIGVDVVHPSAVEKHLPSIAAVVGNVDINVTKFHASVQILAARQELVIGIEKQFRERLVEYNVVNKSFPKNIIVFRDGVSEGQFMQVLDEELIALRRACKSFIKNCQPLITFVVVQKRHHARFFCCDEAAARGRGKNIPAGTVVDRAVTSPDEYDFFLCSHHGIQGTSRPTRYHVLLDESNMNANTMQSITYYLCHIYGRCTRSVSIPAPVYFAHLVCARARYHVLAALNSGLVEKFSDEDSSSSSSSSKAESVKAELVKIIALHSRVKKVMYYA